MAASPRQVREMGAEPLARDAFASFDLSGRRVLVTGAAHGLGLAMASAFIGAGASVAMSDVDESALVEAAREVGGVTAAIALDTRVDESVEGAVAGAASELGGLDVLINNAAVYPTAAFEELTSDAFSSVLDVNVIGYARAARAALPFLMRSGRGRIVNLASITFFLGFPPGLSAYIASKGAVIGLTHALAREFGPDEVTVNSIAPGAFPTRAEEIIDDRTAYDRLILESQCIKRRGRVSDIAGASLFLASDAASFITGQTLIVDGGWVFS
jgi:NAD(P)-dependent dehydrogenase (short-subunit alcohol dehydrogenase family)